MVEPISDAGLVDWRDEARRSVRSVFLPKKIALRIYARIDADAARIRSLEAERDALKAALEPFAKEGRLFVVGSMFAHLDDLDGCSMPVGDLRRAHRALTPSPSDV